MGLTVPGVPWVPPAAAGTSGTAQTARPSIYSVTAAAGPDGLPRAEFREPGGAACYLTRVTVSSSVASSAYLYVGDVSRANLVSGTSAGNFDENDTSQPIYVPEGTSVFTCWDKASTDAILRLEYFTF